MAEKKYLDDTGLATFKEQLVNQIPTKTSQLENDSGYVTSAGGKNVVGSSTATSDTTTALTNGNVYINSVVSGEVTSSHKISGSGATTVTTDASGNIVVTSTNTNTDTKVTNTLATTTKAYVTGTTSATTNTGTQVFDTGVYLDTTAGKLTAKTFSGSLSGNATSATKLATARTINGVSFNGTANITLYTVATTAEIDALFE